MKKLFTKLLAVISAGIIAATANMSVLAAETVDYDDELWMVEYVTGKKVIYSQKPANYSEDDVFKHITYVTEDGSLDNYGYGGIMVRYIVPDNSGEFTLEKLGLSSEDYRLVYDFKDCSVNGAKVYAIPVDTLEEADILFEKAKSMADTGVFINAYKQCMFVHGCYYGPRDFTVKLKDADAGFDFSCIENYEDLTITQSETDPTVYNIKVINGFDYIAIKEAEETIKADENVESVEMVLAFCAVAHEETKNEYIYEETIVPYYAFMTLAGDINLDKETGISDVVTITKYTTSPELYSIIDDSSLGNADMNRDNVINSLDTAILIENLLGGFESAV